MTSQDIRKLFLDFFKKKKHTIVDSSSLIIKDDPTLMFVNAGMNQFKNIFLGDTRPSDLRVVNSQKCLRVSGKHNDLDEVGHDTYHHTLFEMLGSWSFGDYFKKDAIEFSWEFLVDICKLDKDRIYVTVFEGDKSDGLSKDEEAFSFWKKFLPEQNIIDGNKQDNFWEMGEIGPCGPCSEIHYDNRDNKYRKEIDGITLVNKDHPQVIEIWNLVFMQYKRLKDKTLVNLPTQHVDTGMGFERLTMIMQGKKSNYDTDIFQPLIQEIANLSGIQYGADNESDIAMRVIADHLRAVSFSIADGQTPSNVKAGYVIRRILRRAIRYGYTFLKFKEPFIYKLLPVLESTMGEQYKELVNNSKLITNVIHQEEQSFLRTLSKGLKRIDEIISQANKSVSGAIVFELYDTYGFPKDLTALILSEYSLTFSSKEFDQEMQNQKERSKASSKSDIGDWLTINDCKEEFKGYDVLELETTISRYRKVKKNNKEFFHLVLEESPFYAESGGQVGDTGILIGGGVTLKILDTKKENDIRYLICDKFFDNIPQSIKAKVDLVRRADISKNHTATHLLHESLRAILGEHVEQKGSLVSDNYLRFDFSHFSKISSDELEKIELDVNNKIQENIQLILHDNLSISQAKQMGALMLFGEKYGDSVRLIEFNSSKELCGGTHVTCTSEIGLFKIKSESSTASGIRRIEAFSGSAALEALKEKEKMHDKLVVLLKNKNIVTSTESLILESKKYAKDLEFYKDHYFKSLKIDLLLNTEKIGSVNFIYKKMDLDAQDLKNFAQGFKKENNLVLLLSSTTGSKVLITLLISNDLISEGYNAKDLINILSKEISGGGGGQDYIATAGGSNLNGLDNTVKKVKELFTKKLA